MPDFGDEITNLEGSLVDVRAIGNSYRSEEVIARTGETWLGLFWHKERLQFRKIRVSVTKETRPNHGYEDSVRLKFPNKFEPVFLARNLTAVKEGEIITLDGSIDSVTEPPHSVSPELKQGFIREYRLNGVKNILRVTTGIQQDGGKVNVLVLEAGKTSQIVTFNLYYKDHNTLYDSIGDLLWIGDMDGDGRLDLYISDYGYEKGGFGSRLYLSSAAEKGKLVKQVAAFNSSGC